MNKFCNSDSHYQNIIDSIVRLTPRYHLSRSLTALHKISVVDDHLGAVHRGLKPRRCREQSFVLKVVRDELHSDRQAGLERDLCGDGGGRDAGEVGRLRAIVQTCSVVAVVGEGEIRESGKMGEEIIINPLGRHKWAALLTWERWRASQE